MIFWWRKVKRLEDENVRLRAEVSMLKAEYRKRDSIIQELDKTLPENPDERRNRLAQATGLYGAGFDKQIKQMIADQQAELARFGHTEREQDFFRSNINCLYLIEDWFKKAVAEHFGNLEEIRRRSVENDTSDINTLIKKYG